MLDHLILSVHFKNPFFSLPFRLDHPYWSILKLTGCFLYLLYSVIELCVISVIEFFSFKSSIQLFFMVSIFLLRTSIWASWMLWAFTHTSRSMILIAVLKGCGNSNICVILGLKVVEIFLILCVSSNFGCVLHILNIMLWSLCFC